MDVDWRWASVPGMFGASAATGMDRVLLPDSPTAILAADLERLDRGLKLTCPEAVVNLT
jgi:hypothetical protein